MKSSWRMRFGCWLEKFLWARRLVLREDWRSAEFVDPASRVMRIRCINRVGGHVVMIERTYRDGHAGGRIVQ